MKKSRKICVKRNKRIKKNKRTKKINNRKKKYGGIRIYDSEGNITDGPERLPDGKNFFRKMSTIKGELEIYKLLFHHPHENIVTVYAIGENYVDIELLNTEEEPKKNMEKLKQDMLKAKQHLQNLGIMYIDWKDDNTGLSVDGNYKLFDFDASGIIDKEDPNKWILEPPHYWSYNNSIENGKTNPIEIDDYSFEVGFT